MDFAKRQLEKYGWKEGKGLGKHEDGMSTALKATLKFDSTGVGHEVGKDFTNKWWENVYDNAAKNIEVVKDDKNIKVKRVANADEVEITTKDYSVRDFKKKNGCMEYGTFLKTAKLTKEGVVNYENIHAPDEQTNTKVKHLSDEELFAICGGRTAHKGARHGLKLSGKLSRIEKQEKMLLKKMKKVHLSEESPETETCKKKLKKLKKLSEAMMEPESEPSTSDSTLNAEKAKKRKKKRKKSVSFSETVLEYTVQEPNDESAGCSSSSVEKVDIQERHLSTPSPTDNEHVTTDEGIEQDCDGKNLDCGQECFSEMQVSKSGKKKKKSKKHDKDANSTEVSTLEISEVVDEEVESNGKEKKKKARKRSENVDIDGVKNIKKKKKHSHHEIEDIDTSMVDLQISE